jgi:DNA processing protein
VVEEAARRSGTLVTARFAAEQGREVFAIPGHPLDPRAEGTNGLLKTGATLATEPGDVLHALAPLTGCADRPIQRYAAPAPAEAADAPLRAAAPPRLLEDGERDRVLAALGPAPVDVDALQRATGVAMRVLQVVLLELQLAGRIERDGGRVALRLDS